MSKKRQGKHDEVMLIPFLDILCSLIGILILIIVVLSAAHLKKAKGRSKEDVEMAVKYDHMLLELRKLEKSDVALQSDLADLEKRQKDLAAKQRELEQLRKQLALAANAALANKQNATTEQTEIDNLRKQIEAITKATQPLKDEIEKLKKLLAERKKKPDEKMASVVVRPSGSGTKQHQRLFFVETTGAGIVFNKSKTEQIRVAQNSVGVDKGYDEFLATVKNTPNAAIIFLIRGDGWWTYLRAAGWAEQAFGLNTGKLPIPGNGVVDLSAFENL